MPVDNIQEFVIESRENLRVIQAGGNKINLERRDPFGFWFVKFEKGMIPASLDQAFTGLDRAYEAVTNYINGNEKRLEELDRARVRTAKREYDAKHSEE